MKNSIRALITGLLGVLSATGLLPVEVEEAIRANAEHIIGVLLLLWTLFNVLRNRQDREARDLGNATIPYPRRPE